MAEQDKPCDRLSGAVWKAGNPAQTLLLVGELSAGLPGTLLHCGSVLICYGLAFLYEPDWLIPSLARDDFRRVYRGKDALEFLLHKGDLFPRGDVAGWRVSNGEWEDRFIKQIDLARPPAAFVCIEGRCGGPLARLDAALWVDPDARPWASLPPDDERAPAWLRKTTVRVYLVPPSGVEELPWLSRSGLP